MPGKIAQWAGKPVATAHGFDIYIQLVKPKTTRGKTRLWVNIRQSNAVKRWRQSECLAYTNGVDIQFEER